MRHVNVNVKVIVSANKIIPSWNPSTCIWANDKYLKSIVDDSKTLCEVLYVMDIISTKMTITKATNVISTMSMNCRDKKLRYKIDCFILRAILLAIALLLIITIICYYHAKHWQKTVLISNNTEMGNNEF